MILTYGGTDYDIGCSQYPASAKVDVIQVKEKSASGVIYREDFSVRTTELTYKFENMKTIDYRVLIDFFINVVNCTMRTFQLADDAGGVISCNFVTPSLKFTKTNYELWAGSFSVEAVE